MNNVGVDISRYERQIILPGIGTNGQKLLGDSRVLVVGVGGLGVPALQYLVASGVGTIGILDSDVIEISNLQRQVIYTTSDIGKYKASVAAERLNLLNPHLTYAVHLCRLDCSNVLAIICQYDIIVDASDNFRTRYILNDACYWMDKPLIYGAVERFEGQISVFNLRNKAGDMGPNYRDLYPIYPSESLYQNCNINGVLGVTTSIIGSIQALEVIKIILSIGEPLSGRLLICDILRNSNSILELTKKFDNVVSGNIPSILNLDDTYKFINQIENIPNHFNLNLLKIALKNGEKLQIIDVREKWEFEKFNIGGINIPIADIFNRIDVLQLDKKIVFVCSNGYRSALVVKRLKYGMGLNGIFLNLHHGLVDDN